MSMIKAWLHDQMEKQATEEEMFFNADMHHEMQQAMMEEMQEPQNPEDFGIDPEDTTTPIQDNDTNEVPF